MKNYPDSPVPRKYMRSSNKKESERVRGRGRERERERERKTTTREPVVVADAREDGFPLKTADIVKNNGVEGTHFGTTDTPDTMEWIRARENDNT